MPSGVQTSIGVKVWTQSTIYVANEIQRALIEIPSMRGLDTGYMTSNLQIISKGLQTWICTRDLKRVHLEIFHPTTDKAVETWQMGLSYETSGTGKTNEFRTDMDKLKDFASKLGKLKAGCCYRVVVDLEDGAPHVEGWAPTTLRDISHLIKKNFGAFIGTPKIGVEMEYWGGT